MGVDYMYANHSKQQYFDIGLFGESCRFRHAGFSYGSRALSLLISHQGSWKSDSIEMVDDISDQTPGYINIGVEAELLILDVDGIKYFNEMDELDFTTFAKMCFYAWILQRKEVIELLNNKYGPGGWQQKYKNDYCNVPPDAWEQRIHEAQSRNIVIYRK